MLDDILATWMNVKVLVAQSCPTLHWTVACQAPLPMGFSRQDYWNGLPFSSLGDLPEPGTEPRSPALKADSLPSEPRGIPRHGYCAKKIIYPEKKNKNSNKSL